MTNIFEKNLPPLTSSSSEQTDVRSKKREIEGVGVGALKSGKIKLADLADDAFDTLGRAMKFADWPTAVQASKLILDRSGFGPKSTLTIEEGMDLSSLTDEQLAAVAFQIGMKLKNTDNPEDPEPESPSAQTLH